MPSTCSSQAVSRAPWSQGRVSSTQTDEVAVAGEGGAHDAERRAVPCRREGAGVAVREDRVAGLDQAGAVRADGEAALDVVVVDRLGAGEQGGRDGRRPRPLVAGGELALPDGAHLGDRPREVDRGRARRREAGGGLVEREAKRRRVVSVRTGSGGAGQGETAGGGHADRRRPANGHVADTSGDLLPGTAVDVALVVRQGELVDEHDLVGQDLDSAHAQARGAQLVGHSGHAVSPRGDARVQVPWSQEARYAACSSVRVSQVTSMVSSLTRAISSSMSAGTT